MRWLRASRDLGDALHLAADEDDGVRLPRLARAVRQQQSPAVCAAALIADLSAPHSELILVIDDADALVESPDGLAFLRALAERAPDRSRVALIGRRVAQLRLIAARAKRQVMHIGAAALRVTPRQTRQIAEAKGWSGAPTALEEARRAAAGNGGILATWLDQMREGGDRAERMRGVVSRAGFPWTTISLDSQCKYALVADGRADAFMRVPSAKGRSENAWDHLSGLVICEEAGAFAGDLDGAPVRCANGPDLTRSRGVLACDRAISDAIVRAAS